MKRLHRYLVRTFGYYEWPVTLYFALPLVVLFLGLYAFCVFAVVTAPFRGDWGAFLAGLFIGWFQTGIIGLVVADFVCGDSE